ncbi:hypothetical protein HELRODRAFT_67681 [Helobdella robusta]|uniref:SNRNP25 ubiquitin-like domain-containing protein n=1 Tax=Helobdella robusta TaxID=6412 RepID=T1FZ37_HELRO|nr:hypothetical protein HELRODRAFT_67681 [Helobdella robusta]ESN96298.1 hypothetical protein HELRODRAFT_67681 [Helobdella robusta]
MQNVNDFNNLMFIIQGDPMLSDLHTSVTIEELNSYISLEHGQSITVNIQRADGIILPVVVLQNATVLDLKKAFQRHVVLKQARENHTTHINWKHIWRSYWLYFSGQKLTENNKLLSEYNIFNRDTITFIKRLKSK